MNAVFYVLLRETKKINKIEFKLVKMIFNLT